MVNNKYDAKSEIYSFGIVIAEVLSGKLQNRGGIVIDLDFIEDEMKPDERVADACPAGLASALRGLSVRCVARYKQRVDSMAIVMRELRGLVAQFAPEEVVFEGEQENEASGAMDSESLRVFREENALLKAQLTKQSEETQRRGKAEEEKVEKCLLCGDSVTQSRGLLCPEGVLAAQSASVSRDTRHFLCDECFGGANLHHQLAVEYRGLFKQHECKLICQYCLPLINAFSEQSVARHLNDAGFARYRKVCDEVKADDLRREFEDRLEVEVERKASVGLMAQRERVARHRLKIAEDILTLKCPSCRLAMLLNFDQCLAVTCSACAVNVCAWCLSGIGSESSAAHEHVRMCAHNPEKNGANGGLFSSEAAFNSHHANRRRQKVSEYLLGVQDSDREAVLEAVAKDLEALGITAISAVDARLASATGASATSSSAFSDVRGEMVGTGRRNAAGSEVVHVFIDVSNLDGKQEGKIDPSRLCKAVIKGRQVAQMYAVGSVQSEREKTSPYWNRWRECEAGAQLVLLVKSREGREEAVDETLHAAILAEASKKYSQRRTMLLLTGDGNDNGGRATSFPHAVEIALRGGWLVEVWCFRVSASSVYKRFADDVSTRSAFQLFDLDRVLFHDGTENALPPSPPLLASSSFSNAKAASKSLQAGAATKTPGGSKVGGGVVGGKALASSASLSSISVSFHVNSVLIMS